MKLLCCAIMVKDEEDRIVRTISTIIKYVGYVVVLDTGSTDNTVQVIRDYCKEKKVPLKLKYEPFVDFSYNRNILLKHCYGLSDFVLLLDANDEVKHPKILIKHLKKTRNQRKVAIFNCRYEWENDGSEHHNYTYCKTGIIRNDTKDLHYEMPIHEFLTSSTHGRWVIDSDLINTKFHIYQDRSKDKSSMPRIKKDIEVITKWIKENGENKRMLTYLCQSYDVMKDYKKLYDNSCKVISYDKKDNNIPYDLELYRGYLWRARSAGTLGMDDFNKYYLEAYKYSKDKGYNNVEPLYELAQMYCNIGNYDLAFIYSKKCCGIPMPKKSNTNTNFIINYEVYKKQRWIQHYNISKKLGHEDDRIWANNEMEKEGLKMIDSNNKTNLESLPKKARDSIQKLMKENKIELMEKKKIPTREELEKRNVGAKMYLIVSYRDREKQLREFIPYMKNYLDAHNIKHEMLISEQKDDGLFNKGILYNISVRYIQNINRTTEKIYLCFHDVDILPIKGTNYYKPLEGELNHLYGYKSALGGVFLINFDDYIKVNGFSNKYDGWGFEDTDFRRRIVNDDLKMNYDYFYVRYDKDCFKELDENELKPIKNMALDQTNVNKELFEKEIDYKKDGLGQIKNFGKYIRIYKNKPPYDYTIIQSNIQEIKKVNNL